MNHTSIRYVCRSQIEDQKWDQCIGEASNGLIYASSFYLDRMCKHWDALVMDEYKAVMPLPWNKKGGIHYLYQPAFTPSLGVFGINLTAELVREFILSIPKKFGLIEINLNAGNELKDFTNSPYFSISRQNFVLPLNKPYHLLFNKYNDNIKRNIRKSVAAGCIVQKNIPIEDVVALAKEQLSNLANLKRKDFENFQFLYRELASRNKATTYGILLNGELLSAAAYFFSHGRAYYILVGNHPNGKTMGTSHFLIDRFIADHAGKDLLLDFEGSDISSLAFFYSSFGAKAEQYPALKLNRLPWFLKWLK